MPINLVRFQKDNKITWGLLEEETVCPLNIPCTTTQDLLSNAQDLLSNGSTATQEAIAQKGEAINANTVNFLSPITAPAKVLCQGANYRQHMIESGMNPNEKNFNMFFTKSTASITGPTGEIIKPGHVNLLDYEVELTLVLGKSTNGSVTVTKENIHEYVAGVCIGNDVSARDVQIPQMQFHKGKSYRTFCPLGPVLCLLSKDEMHYLDELQLELSVNGETRQSDSTANLVFKPAEALTEYSQIHDFEAGDVLMTGTPSGCALGLPSPAVVKISSLLPEATRWKMFKKMQGKRKQYLQAGDKIVATIKSRDGVINLGMQNHTIVNA